MPPARYAIAFLANLKIAFLIPKKAIAYGTLRERIPHTSKKLLPFFILKKPINPLFP